MPTGAPRYGDYQSREKTLVSLEKITSFFRGNIHKESFHGTIKLAFKDEEGVIYIDGNSGQVTNENKSADCTVTYPHLKDADELVVGKADATSLMMQGRMHISGDMAIAHDFVKALHEARVGRSPGH